MGKPLKWVEFFWLGVDFGSPLSQPMATQTTKERLGTDDSRLASVETLLWGCFTKHKVENMSLESSEY